MRNFIKIFLTILLLFNINKSKAQTDSSSYVERYDIYIENINKNQIPFGILYDRVAAHSMLNYQYSNPEAGEQIYYDFKHWKQAYYELYLATFEQGPLDPLENISSNLFDEYYLNKSVNVGVLDFDYSYIDSNAIKNNLFEIIEGKLFDIAERTESPYLTGRYTEFSLLSEKIYTGNNLISFNSNYFLKNTEHGILYIEVDFNDQDLPLQTFEIGNTYNLEFQESGNHVVTYTIYFDDNTQFSGTTNMFVNARTTFTQNIREKKFHFSNSWSDYNSQVKEAKVDAYYFYNSNDTLIEKPIIITDGFDPGDTRDGYDLYELMYYGPQNNRKNLADELNAKGFDVIFLNFPKEYGAEFIERNAIAVEKFITNELNVIKLSTAEKTIVVGPSMGGLVTRYALAELEKLNIDHKVSLYISFDSPHQGANIPIGGQNFLVSYANLTNLAEALESVAKLNTPAAKQMLLHHFELRPELVIPSIYRNNFKTNLINNGQSLSKGYPLNLRKIALINGSQTVAEQGLNNVLFNSFGSAIADVYKSPQYATRSLVSTLFLGPIGDFNGYIPELGNRYARAAVPNGSNPASPINGSLDNSPGGKYNLVAQICLNGDGSLKSGYTMNSPEQSFIPSVSALDIQYDNGYILDVKYNIKSKNIICSNQTPFSAYFAPTQNEKHVAITPESATWLFNEIENANKSTEAGQAAGYEIGSGQIFNYGAKTRTYLSRSLVVKDGGTLAVNKNSSTGFGNESTPTTGSTFNVNTYQTCNNAIGIEVRANSFFTIGDNNGNKGTFTFMEGSVFTLKANSKLTIHDNSELILPANSTFNFEPGAVIELLGNNAKLTINGNLDIKANATFTFTGSGFISINNNLTVTMGTNSHFSINGSGQTDKVLEINNGTLYFPYGTGTTKKFTATNCNIVTSGTGKLEVASDLVLNNVKLSGVLGLTTYGQDPVNIQNSTFNSVPVNAYQSGGDGVALYINNCDFNSSVLNVYDKGVTIDNSTFHNYSGYSPVVLENLIFTSYIKNSNFYDLGNNAIEYSGNTSAPLELDNVTIDDSYNGVVATNTFIKSKCSNINSFGSPIQLVSNAQLDMSTQNGGLFRYNVLKHNYSDQGGDPLIYIDEAEAVFLDEGQNEFRKEYTANKFIAGLFNDNTTNVIAENNKWYKCTSCTNAAPTSTDFQLPFINILDVTPISTSYSADPCGGGGSESFMMASTSNADLLDVCSECETVKINGEKINKKLKKVFNEIASDTLKIHTIEHINKLDSIINLSVNGNKPKVEKLQSRAYANYIKLVQDYLSNSTSTVVANQYYTKALNTTNTRLAKAIVRNDTIKIKYYLLNKAYLLLNKDEYTSALIVFNNALQLTKQGSRESAFLQNQICLVTNEELFVNGVISSSEFDSLRSSCKVVTTNSSLMRNANVASLNSSKSTILEFAISPNPANTTLGVELNNFNESLTYEYQIVDLSGRLIYQKTNKGLNKLSIDVSDIAEGAYFLKVTDGTMIKTSKFVIVR